MRPGSLLSTPEGNTSWQSHSKPTTQRRSVCPVIPATNTRSPSARKWPTWLRFNGNGNGAHHDRWQCSPKQNDLILKIIGENGHVKALMLDDGTELSCDLLVMAVGIRPNTALAQEAGLATGRGIHVDDQMLTSDPDVYAVGECV